MRLTNHCLQIQQTCKNLQYTTPHSDVAHQGLAIQVDLQLDDAMIIARLYRSLCQDQKLHPIILVN